VKNLYLSTTIICIAALMINCGGEDEVEESYYPLNIGNEWNYEVTMTVDMSGTPYIYTGTSQDQIIGITQLTGGKSVFQFATLLTLNGYYGNDTFYMHETDTAVYIYEELDDTLPDKYLEFPIVNGNTWTVNPTQTAAVLGSVDISVPAGNYNDCWEIAYFDGDDTVFVYLAKGIGEVKGYATDVYSDTTVTLSLELVDVSIQ
jgi:hypothetical protein